MDVIDNFGKPFFPKQPGDRLRLFQIQHEPIAVIVVTRVVVIKLRRLASFGRCAQRFSIPIGDDVNSVRIRRRNENQNRVTQNRKRVFIGRAGEVVGELHRHLRSHNLSRMNRTGNDYYSLAFLY